MLETIDGIVSIANDNCPGQLVISGEKEAVDKAAAALSENGARNSYDSFGCSYSFYSARCLKSSGD